MSRLIPNFNKKNSIKDRSKEFKDNIHTLLQQSSKNGESDIFSYRLIYGFILQRFVDLELSNFEEEIKNKFLDGIYDQEEIFTYFVNLFIRCCNNLLIEDSQCRNVLYTYDQSKSASSIATALIAGMRSSLTTTLGFIDVYKEKSLNKSISYDNISYLVNYMSVLHKNSLTIVEANLRNLSYHDFVSHTIFMSIKDIAIKYPYDAKNFIIDSAGKMKFSKEFTVSLDHEDVSPPYDINRTKCVANAVKVNKGKENETSLTTHLCTMMTNVYAKSL